MSLLLLITFTLLTVFRSDIKGFESYSLGTERPDIQYELKPGEGVDQSLDPVNYQPNAAGFLNLTLSHKYISFSVSVPNEEQDNPDIEKSNLFDVQLFGHFKNHLWEVYYQNYQGLYILDEANNLQADLPTANTWSYGASMKRFTNENFKIRSSYSYFSKNKVSNWSGVQGVFINKARLFSSKPLVPNKYLQNYDQLNGLKAFETTTIGLVFGLTGLYTKYNWFISGLVGIGMNIQKQEFSGIDTEERVVTASASSATIDLGYDGSWGSVGLQTRRSGYDIPIKNSTYSISRITTSIYYKYFF